jgi:hypothetical protein
MIFADGSRLTLPQVWENVFLADFGADPTTYDQIAERLRFVVGKYIAYRAWPTKFDGLLHDASDDDRRYDDPDFYFEHWDEWKETGKAWGTRTITDPPTWADVAEAVMYQQLRAGLMQQASQEVAAQNGVTPPKVLTPEQFLYELERHHQEGNEHNE